MPDKVMARVDKALTIDKASVYFNIGEKKLRKIVTDNLDTGLIIQNGVKFLIKQKRFKEHLEGLTAIQKVIQAASKIVVFRILISNAAFIFKMAKELCLWYTTVYRDTGPR